MCLGLWSSPERKRQTCVSRKRQSSCLQGGHPTLQKPPSLVSMSAWDAVGPGCPGAMVVLGLCLEEIVSGLLTLSTFPFTSSRACSLPFTGHVGEAQPLY